MDPSLVETIMALVESQGTAHYVALALDELRLEFVEDVASEEVDYFLARCVALYEESER